MLASTVDFSGTWLPFFMVRACHCKVAFSINGEGKYAIVSHVEKFMHVIHTS